MNPVLSFLFYFVLDYSRDPQENFMKFHCSYSVSKAILQYSLRRDFPSEHPPHSNTQVWFTGVSSVNTPFKQKTLQSTIWHLPQCPSCREMAHRFRMKDIDQAAEWKCVISEKETYFDLHILNTDNHCFPPFPPHKRSLFPRRKTESGNRNILIELQVAKK